MKTSKKSNKIIMLITLILLIIIGSIVMVVYDKNKVSDNNLNTDKNADGIDTELKSEEYYSESLLYEGEHGIMSDCIFDYSGDAVKFILDDSLMKLVNLSTDEIIKEFSQVENYELFSKGSYYVDDNLNIVTISYYKDNNQVVLEKFDLNGNKIESTVLKDCQISFYNEYMSKSKIKVDEKYIYFLNDQNLQIFQLSGELYATYKNISDFDADKKGNIYITHDSTKSNGFIGFEKININTQESVYEVSTNVGDISYNEEGNFIYFIKLDEISKFNAQDGKFIEKVFKFGVDSSFLAGYGSDVYIESFFVDEKFNLFISCRKLVANWSAMCCKYELTKGTRPEKQITLTVTSPYKQDFLADAIIRYELKYTDQKVKYDYEYMSRQEFNNNESNYGKRLTTKILVNDIGDIVLTGGSTLVFRNIFKTDAFMDLSELIKNDKNYDVLNKAALEGMIIDGAIRGLPVSLVYNFYEINIALLEKMGIEIDYNNLKWSDVLDLLSVIEKKAPYSYLFITYRSEDFELSMYNILEPMLIANMPDLIDLENKKTNINAEWFVNLLKKLKKALSSENFIQKDATPSAVDGIHDALFNYRANIETYQRDLVYRYYYYQQNGKKSEYIPLFKGEKSDNRVSKSINMYSINNRSENKENAWKFLSFLLEDEVQSLIKIPGTAINLETEKKQSYKLEKEYNTGENKEENKSFWEMMEPIYTDMDYMYDLDYFKNDIKTPILEYLQDKISLEEAIKKAEDNVWIRLNE